MPFISKLQCATKFMFRTIQSNFSSKCLQINKKLSTESIQTVIPLINSTHSHEKKFNAFLAANPHILALRSEIPTKYTTTLKRKDKLTFVYLIASDVAKKVVSYVLPDLQANPNQLIGLSNPGLGLIATELLVAGITPLRLYEACPLFQDHLKTAFASYEESVKLYKKDIFTLHWWNYKQEHDSIQVEQLLEGIPKKIWGDSPALSIIGSLSDKSFIYYLIKSLVEQESVMLTAGPHLNLQTYTTWSVLFNLFFDFEVLDTFPKEVLVPWQIKQHHKKLSYVSQIDPHLMYFVKIGFKKNLPVPTKHLLPLYAFIRHFLKIRSTQVIPALEKWRPGLGFNVLIPRGNHGDKFPNINIFTTFGELTPTEILAIFEEIVLHTEIDRDLLLLLTTMVDSEFDTACNDYFSDKTSNTAKIEQPTDDGDHVKSSL